MTIADITTSKTFTRGQHTGYTVQNDSGAVVATVNKSRLRGDHGYYVRCYIAPDDYTITRAESILDARDIAEQHAIRSASRWSL